MTRSRLHATPIHMASYSWDQNLERLMSSLAEAREITRTLGNCPHARNDLNSMRALISIYILTGRIDWRFADDCLERLRTACYATSP